MTEPQDQRPMTWVEAHAPKFANLAERYHAERKVKVVPFFSAYAASKRPGWFFPTPWVEGAEMSSRYSVAKGRT